MGGQGDPRQPCGRKEAGAFLSTGAISGAADIYLIGLECDRKERNIVGFEWERHGRGQGNS
jgi:hypothetical protein